MSILAEGGIIMGRPRKYKDLYGPQKKYRSTENGKAAIKKYESTERRKAAQRERSRIRQGTIADKRQWFIDTYKDPGVALELLNQKEKLVIKYSYGLDGGPPLTQLAIASMMECSRQWISQIKKSALNKLAPIKRAIKDNPPPKK